jgi:hypothetical protein
LLELAVGRGIGAVGHLALLLHPRPKAAGSTDRARFDLDQQFDLPAWEHVRASIATIIQVGKTPPNRAVASRRLA